MRICCFTICLGQGGAERQLVSLASLLKKEGNDVTVLTYIPDFFYLNQLEESGVSFHCACHHKNNLFRLFDCLKFIRKFRAETVISYLEMPSFMACLMKMMGFKFKLIVSERNTTQVQTIFDLVRFRLLKYADYIVPNSYSQSSFIKETYPFLTKKIVTITNYVDVDYFVPLNTMSSEFIILTVARIDEQKNLLRYIDAAKSIIDANPNVVFRVYGRRMEVGNYYEDCIRKIDTLKLKSNFQIVEPTTDILKAYQEATVFCLPSIYEGFPNVVCEAMSCGLPVVCSNVCDNPLIVEEGVNGFLFNPNRTDEIYKALKKIIEMPPAIRNQMGKKSREIALAKFSNKMFIDKYKSLL